jgi:O-antigen/teichoic acid export membrane protein
MSDSQQLTYRRIFRLWLPLAATWLMMAVEGPFLAAVIARLAEPTFNLAAYGIAFAFATVAEAPIIMILSATTALVRDMDSYRKVRNFAFALNLGVTAIILMGLVPSVFDWIALDLVALPEPVAELTHRALLLLVPWPAAIGFRRFYQGLLIRQELTRRVAMGTVIRVIGMAGGAVFLAKALELPGALSGAGALSIGVVLEALGTRLMAWGIKHRVERSTLPGAQRRPERLTLSRIVEFYYPLALTSVLALAVQPMVTFFLGGSRRAIDSLAVLPVVAALTFLFRSFGISYQEVGIALLDGTRENFRLLTRFALAIGIAATAGLALIAFTPLARIWFGPISGLSPELAEFSVVPLRIFCPIPFFALLLSYQRAILVYGRSTRPVTVATILEVAGILAMLFLTVRVLDVVGVVAAVTSLLAGRLVGTAYMLYPCHAVLSNAGIVRNGSRAAATVPLPGSDRI